MVCSEYLARSMQYKKNDIDTILYWQKMQFSLEGPVVARAWQSAILWWIKGYLCGIVQIGLDINWI
jgi:hypothetical protein